MRNTLDLWWSEWIIDIIENFWIKFTNFSRQNKIEAYTQLQCKDMGGSKVYWVGLNKILSNELLALASGVLLDLVKLPLCTIFYLFIQGEQKVYRKFNTKFIFLNVKNSYLHNFDIKIFFTSNKPTLQKFYFIILVYT